MVIIQKLIIDFCTTAFRNLRPGGRFVTLTQMLVNALRTDGSRDPNAPNIILTARGKGDINWFYQGRFNLVLSVSVSTKRIYRLLLKTFLELIYVKMLSIKKINSQLIFISF